MTAKKAPSAKNGMKMQPYPRDAAFGLDAEPTVSTVSRAAIFSSQNNDVRSGLKRSVGQSRHELELCSRPIALVGYRQNIGILICALIRVEKHKVVQTERRLPGMLVQRRG